MFLRTTARPGDPAGHQPEAEGRMGIAETKIYPINTGMAGGRPRHIHLLERPRRAEDLEPRLLLLCRHRRAQGPDRHGPLRRAARYQDTTTNARSAAAWRSTTTFRQKLGVDPDEIDAIVFTHLHWDHVQNMKRFPQRALHCASQGDRVGLQPAPPLLSHLRVARARHRAGLYGLRVRGGRGGDRDPARPHHVPHARPFARPHGGDGAGRARGTSSSRGTRSSRPATSSPTRRSAGATGCRHGS